MSVYATTNANDLFTALVPGAAPVVVIAYRMTLAPRLALWRVRRGRPVRIPLPVGGSVSGTEDEVARISRVEDGGHVFGPDFHWVVPISGLSLVDPAQTFRLTDERRHVNRVHVSERWRPVFAAAMTERGPRWRARSWRTRWLAAPTWTMATVAYFAAMTVLAGLMVITSTQHVGSVDRTAGNECSVLAVDGGSEYTQWMRCGFDVETGDEVTFYALPWPFEGEAYRLEQMVFMVATLAGIALAFATGHVGYALVRRRRVGEPRYVVDEGPASAPDGANLWLDIYLPEMAALLDWPDRPAALIDPEAVEELPEQDREQIRDTEGASEDSLWWRFHAVRGGDDAWLLLLDSQADANEVATWLLTPDRPPALQGLARLPHDPPSSGWLRLSYPPSTGRDQTARGLTDGWAAYHDLQRVDDLTLASLREDLVGQVRDREEEREGRDG